MHPRTWLPVGAPSRGGAVASADTGGGECARAASASCSRRRQVTPAFVICIHTLRD